MEQEAERKAMTVWAEGEARTFVEKFLMYPKNFEKIATCLDGKTTRDCVVGFTLNGTQFQQQQQAAATAATTAVRIVQNTFLAVLLSNKFAGFAQPSCMLRQCTFAWLYFSGF